MRWVLLVLCTLTAGCANLTISGPVGRGRIVDDETGAPVGKAAIAALVIARVKCVHLHLEGEECERIYQRIDSRTDSDGYFNIPAWGPWEVGSLANPDGLYPRIYVYAPGYGYMAGAALSKCRGPCADARPGAAWFEGQQLTLHKVKMRKFQFVSDSLVIGPGHGECEWLELANWTAAVYIDLEREYIARTIKELELVQNPGHYWSAKYRAEVAAHLTALRSGKLSYEERFGRGYVWQAYGLDPTTCPDGQRILDERIEYFRTP